MMPLIKLEFKQAFSSIGFKFAMVINMILSLTQVVENIIHTNALNQANASLEQRYGFYEIDLFNRWIGTDCIMVSSAIFFAILPLTSILPYGCSYLSEKKTVIIYI